MFPLHVGEFGRQLLDHVHVAKGGAEDQFVALRGQIAQHALGVGAFGHALHIGGLDLVAELFLQRLAAAVVRKRIAAVAHRADVGKRDLQRLGRRRCGSSRSRSRRRCGRRRLFLLAAANQCGSRHGGQCCHLDQRTFLEIRHGDDSFVG
ncbi:hypothetical protein SDC9_133546 [bioreactor metagenome]|uniref:Uncharacterized protein n=1 Tax=bioreactor metagenome TaxID=1076179 RepID=A0A645DB99_9ZZZZ